MYLNFIDMIYKRKLNGTVKIHIQDKDEIDALYRCINTYSNHYDYKEVDNLQDFLYNCAYDKKALMWKDILIIVWFTLYLAAGIYVAYLTLKMNMNIFVWIFIVCSVALTSTCLVAYSDLTYPLFHSFDMIKRLFNNKTTYKFN